MPKNRGELPEEPEELPKGIKEQPLEVPPAAEHEREENTEEEIEKVREEIEQSFTREIPHETAYEDAADTHKPVERHVSSIKRLGIKVGESLGWIKKSLEERAASFNVECRGREHLDALRGQAYIIAPNHTKPSNILFQSIGLSPDSFLIGQKVTEKTGQKPRIATNVSGKIGKIPVIGLLDKVWSPFREGMMEGMGFLPVRRDNRLNRNFVEKTRQVLENNEPVIMFPEGHWYKEFSEERPFKTGVATTARTNEVPVVPVYIEGGRTWKRGTKAFIEFGAPINTTGKTKEQITEEMKAAISVMEKVRHHE